MNFFQGGMLQAIERYMKQAIVDKNSSVSSAALVSSLVSILIKKIPFIFYNFTMKYKKSAFCAKSNFLVPQKISKKGL